MGFFGGIGRGAAERAETFSSACAFLGETFASFLALAFKPRRFRFGDFAAAFCKSSTDAVLIVAGVGLLLGVILAFESAVALRMFGAEVYVSDLLCVGLFRELGPLVAAVLLSGRTASAFAAEIGTMKAGEELDALRTMGLSPVGFLVPPRIFAAMLAMPVLAIVSDLAGLAGGAGVLRMMGVPPVVFWSHVKSTADVWMISYGLLKSLLFGFIAGSTGCFCGMDAKATADGVGAAATSAVVGSIVLVGAADGIIAVMGYIWGF